MAEVVRLAATNTWGNRTRYKVLAWSYAPTHSRARQIQFDPKGNATVTRSQRSTRTWKVTFKVSAEESNTSYARLSDLEALYTTLGVKYFLIQGETVPVIFLDLQIQPITARHDGAGSVFHATCTLMEVVA